MSILKLIAVRHDFSKLHPSEDLKFFVFDLLGLRIKKTLTSTTISFNFIECIGSSSKHVRSKTDRLESRFVEIELLTRFESFGYC